jgi:hypothetical protein
MSWVLIYISTNFLAPLPCISPGIIDFSSKFLPKLTNFSHSTPIRKKPDLTPKKAELYQKFGSQKSLNWLKSAHRPAKAGPSARVIPLPAKAGPHRSAPPRLPQVNSSASTILPRTALAPPLLDSTTSLHACVLPLLSSSLPHAQSSTPRHCVDPPLLRSTSSHRPPTLYSASHAPNLPRGSPLRQSSFRCRPPATTTPFPASRSPPGPRSALLTSTGNSRPPPEKANQVLLKPAYIRPAPY